MNGNKTVRAGSKHAGAGPDRAVSRLWRHAAKGAPLQGDCSIQIWPPGPGRKSDTLRCGGDLEDTARRLRPRPPGSGQTRVPRLRSPFRVFGWRCRLRGSSAVTGEWRPIGRSTSRCGPCRNQGSTMGAGWAPLIGSGALGTRPGIRSLFLMPRSRPGRQRRGNQTAFPAIRCETFPGKNRNWGHSYDF